MGDTVLLTAKQAAKMLSVSESFFRRKVAHEVGRIVFTPRCVRFRFCDIEEYAERIKKEKED